MKSIEETQSVLPPLIDFYNLTSINNQNKVNIPSLRIAPMVTNLRMAHIFINTLTRFIV